METMDNSILLEEELLKNKIAKCPRCKDGVIRPTFPQHTDPISFTCDKCGGKVLFERNVVVE